MTQDAVEGYNPLATARIILADPADDGNHDVIRWASLVIARHGAGRSIKNAGDWLSSLMIGVNPDYLD